MIKAEWTNNDALSAEQTTHSNAHNTLNALDCVSRQYAIEHYQHVCRRTNCKECPLHIQVTDTLTDCELELFLHNLPSAQPDENKYEYHYDHTDCIWYRPEARNRCPVTCAQYRDGWNDAMNYIFRDGKGYMPYRRDKQYGE